MRCEYCGETFRQHEEFDALNFLPLGASWEYCKKQIVRFGALKKEGK